MNLKSLIPVALLAIAVPAGAQVQQQQTGGSRNATVGTAERGGTVRVAMANPSRIFQQMQETKDLKANLESEGARLMAEEKEKQAGLKNLQAKRNQLKPDTPQWDELNTQLMDGALELRLWGEQTKAKAERTQKRQMKHLFEQIEQAIAEVAQRDGYDLVIADQRPELPDNLDQINFDQLRALINTRNVLYASPKADISDAVIALLDSKYKGRGGAAANGGNPAPAGPRRGAAPAPAARQGGNAGPANASGAE